MTFPECRVYTTQFHWNAPLYKHVGSDTWCADPDPNQTLGEYRVKIRMSREQAELMGYEVIE